MYLYKVKFSNDYFEDELYQPLFMRHDKKYSKEEFDNLLRVIRFEMGHFVDFEDLPSYLDGYGFIKDTGGNYKEAITVYFEKHE